MREEKPEFLLGEEQDVPKESKLYNASMTPGEMLINQLEELLNDSNS